MRTGSCRLPSRRGARRGLTSRVAVFMRLAIRRLPERPGGVYPTQVAEWAGHSIDALLPMYAKCVVDQDELPKRRITEALRQD